MRCSSFVSSNRSAHHPSFPPTPGDRRSLPVPPCTSVSRRRNRGRCFRCYFRPPPAARPNSLPENGKCLFRGGERENGLDHLPTKKRARANTFLLFRFSFVYRITHNRISSAFILFKIYVFALLLRNKRN